MASPPASFHPFTSSSRRALLGTNSQFGAQHFQLWEKKKKIKKIKAENAGVEEEISQISTAGIYSGVETPERCLHPARDLFRGLTSSFLNEQPSTGNGTNVTRPSRVLQPCSLAALEVQGLVKDDFFLPEIAYIEKSPQPLSAV